MTDYLFFIKCKKKENFLVWNIKISTFACSEYIA